MDERRLNAPIRQLLERPQGALSRMAALHTLLEPLAVKITGRLLVLFALDEPMRLEPLRQGDIAADEALQSVLVAHMVRDWGGPILVRFDRAFLFRVLNAIYGGDPSKPIVVPQRPLTPLESSVAVEAAQCVAAELQAALAGVCDITVSTGRVVETGVASASRPAKGGQLIIAMTSEAKGRLEVALPPVGLDLVRAQLKVAKPEAETDLDPRWTSEFRQSVLSSRVALSAAFDGPGMLLSGIADLRPGTLLEFDGDCLRNVRLESEKTPLFVGRLGQSKGHFTICLDEPAAKSAPGAEEP